MMGMHNLNNEELASHFIRHFTETSLDTCDVAHQGSEPTVEVVEHIVRQACACCVGCDVARLSSRYRPVFSWASLGSFRMRGLSSPLLAARLLLTRTYRLDDRLG